MEVCSHLSVLPAVTALPGAATVLVVGCFKNQLSNVTQSLSTWLQKKQIKVSQAYNTSNTSLYETVIRKTQQKTLE